MTVGLRMSGDPNFDAVLGPGNVVPGHYQLGGVGCLQRNLKVKICCVIEFK